MSERVALCIADDAARDYDHGPQHPLRIQRVLLTWELIRAYGLTERPNVAEVTAGVATDEEVALVHRPEFIEATRRAGHGESGNWWRFGYGPGDNPIFRNMHEASAAVVGASIRAADEVLSGRAEHAFNAAGGLHHAMPARASGFCVYDDPAVAIRWLLVQGVERVAYIDVDVHHGDGPQAIFWDEPRVMTVSIHESGRYLFPGTGFEDERGGGDAEGTKVNVPLPPSTGDDAWLSAFRQAVVPPVREFRPDVLVTQLGCDTHTTDPLAHLELSTRAYREAAKLMHGLAHEVADGRWVATGGGGYQWARVVPRAWTTYFVEMAGAEVPDDLPADWVRLAEEEAGHPLTRSLADPT